MESKQVIVMRKFAGLRTGKYVAQGAHASVGALLSISKLQDKQSVIDLSDPHVHAWVTGRFKKISVYVNSDEEIVDLYNQAMHAGLPCALIRDAGLTEFNGVPTITALGIGPGDPEKIDKITGKLPLF